MAPGGSAMAWIVSNTETPRYLPNLQRNDTPNLAGRGFPGAGSVLHEVSRAALYVRSQHETRCTADSRHTSVLGQTRNGRRVPRPLIRLLMTGKGLVLTGASGELSTHRPVTSGPPTPAAPWRDRICLQIGDSNVPAVMARVRPPIHCVVFKGYVVHRLEGYIRYADRA